MNSFKLVIAFVCVLAVSETSWAAADDFGTNYYVGNWTTTGTNFTQWTQGKTFYVGDSLTFTVSGGETVFWGSQDDYDSCSASKIPIFLNSDRNVTVFPFLGNNYYISSVESKCKAGLKLNVTVVSRPSPPAYVEKSYKVGDDKGWALGVDYQNWTNNKEFFFGDTFDFVFNASVHSVVEVWKSAYENCNESYVLPVSSPGKLQSDGKTVVTVLPPIGTRYFVSSISDDCQKGLKIKLEIEPTYEAFEPASAPDNSADSPGSANSPRGSAVNQENSGVSTRLGFKFFSFLLAAAYLVV